MAEAESVSFAFQLESQLAATAARDANALETLNTTIQGSVSELREMQKAHRNLKGGGNSSTEAIKQLNMQIAAQKAVIAGAQQSYLRLGGTFKNTSSQTTFATMVHKGLQDRVKGGLGPLGQLVKGLGEMSTRQLVAAAAGVVLGGAVLAVTAIFAAAAAALARYGIAQADARRSELLRLEGLTKIRNLWGGFDGQMGRSADKASWLQVQIDRVSGSVALGRDKVAGYTEQLYRMGLRGGALQDALEGVAITAAVQGEAQAQAFAGAAAGAAMVGQSVRRLSDDVKGRLGGIAKAQMLSLDVQTAKLHESFAMLFSGVKLDRLLEGLSEVTNLFNQSTATGRALKLILSTMMQPLLDATGGAAPIVKRFFQGMVIGALVATIAMLKLRNWWRHTFGTDAKGGLDLTTAALYGGVAAVALLALSIGAVTLAAGGLAVAAIPALIGLTAWLGSAALAGLALAAPFLLGAVAIAAVGVAAYQGYKLWKEIDWGSLGSGIVDGIVGGLTRGLRKVKEAVSSLAQHAVKAFRDTLDMHSPSRLFYKTTGGVTDAVVNRFEDDRPRVGRAVGGLVSPDDLTDAPAGASGGEGGAGRAGGDTVNNNVTVNIENVQASGDIESVVAELRRAVEREFAAAATAMGARRPALI